MILIFKNIAFDIMDGDDTVLSFLIFNGQKRSLGILVVTIAENVSVIFLNGEKKFKFEPVLWNIFEIENWINNQLTPNTIYVESINEKNIIIILFDYETKEKTDNLLINKARTMKILKNKFIILV